MSEARTFGAEYYRQNYPDYARQNPPRKLNFYRSLVESATAETERPRVLDIGCAFGAFLNTLPPNWNRHGVDPSEFAITHTKKKMPNATFAVGSADAVPFTGPFDCVTAFDTLEHVPDLDRVAIELKRLLAPGAALVFVVPVYDGPTGPIIHALDRDPTHVHKHARSFWLDWANQHFRVAGWQGIYRYLLPGGYYAHVPTQRWRQYTPAIAVTAALTATASD